MAHVGCEYGRGRLGKADWGGGTADGGWIAENEVGDVDVVAIEGISGGAVL
jgi:hypothetical protein